MQNIEVVERICDILDELRPMDKPRRRLIEFVPDRPGHDRRYAIDPVKIESELGWRPLETFSTGIEKTVRWYLDSEHWWRPLREKVYSGQRLGLIEGKAA
jgi:dTDP-glucose 4,6-dehydratase